MKKYFLLTMMMLSIAFLSGAATYYSDPVGGNFNAAIWGTSTTGPFNIAGTAITAADDIFVQGGTVVLNLSSGSTYGRNMTVQSGATATTVQQATFAGDVTVQSGGVILLGPLGNNTGSIFVQNLFVNSGGKVWGNDPVNSGALNVKTIRINGSQLVCDGVIGDGANNDGLLLQPEGAIVTISGTGSIDVSRIRKGAATNTVTSLIIDANVNCRFGTTCIYNNQNSSTFNITINANKTLKCIGIANPTGFAGTEGSISLNGTTGGSTRRQALYTINGTLECDNMYLAATSTTATDVFKYIVTSSGTLKVNTQLKGNSATASTAATADLQLQSGAFLKLSGTAPTSAIDASGTKNVFTFDAASTVEYSGNPQALESKFGNYGNLIINSAGGGIATDNDITVTGILSLVAGTVTVPSSKQLKLTNVSSSALSGGSSSSFINGKLVRAVVPGNTYSFPIGKDNTYANASIANIAAATDIAAEYFKTPYSNLTTVATFKVSAIEYWSITGNGTNSIAANITLNYSNGNSSGITAPSLLSLAYYNGTQWSNLGQVSNTGNATAGSVTGNTVALGVFTFGTTSSLNPLPVKLSGFTAQLTNKGFAELKWETATEINLDYFMLEKSIDGINFYPLTKVPAANKPGGATYQYTDASIFKGKRYYRLKSVDKDASAVYSLLVSVMDSNNRLPLLLKQDGLYKIVFPESTTFTVTVLNAQGQAMLYKNVTGTGTEINDGPLPRGNYVLYIRYNNQQTSFLIFK